MPLRVLTCTSRRCTAERSLPRHCLQSVRSIRDRDCSAAMQFPYNLPSMAAWLTSRHSTSPTRTAAPRDQAVKTRDAHGALLDRIIIALPQPAHLRHPHLRARSHRHPSPAAQTAAGAAHPPPPGAASAHVRHTLQLQCKPTACARLLSGGRKPVNKCRAVCSWAASTASAPRGARAQQGRLPAWQCADALNSCDSNSGAKHS